MDFALNDEQQEFKDYCRKFSREVIRPAAPQHDADESTPWEVLKEARKWGLHGLDLIQRLNSDRDGLYSTIYAE
ncbi:MAG: acyl-CoA dehydrogenase family protein, partial [Solirubrobacterales bacterium]